MIDLAVKFIQPQKINLPFPEVIGICIGKCGLTEDDLHYDPYTPVIIDSRASGHAHLCHRDVLYRCICISDEKFIYNSDRSVTDLMWHEYGHILDKFPSVIECQSNNLHILGGVFEPHGKSWIKVMKSLGKSHINSPFVSSPY